MLFIQPLFLFVKMHHLFSADELSILVDAQTSVTETLLLLSFMIFAR